MLLQIATGQSDKWRHMKLNGAWQNHKKSNLINIKQNCVFTTKKVSKSQKQLVLSKFFQKNNNELICFWLIFILRIFDL